MKTEVVEEGIRVLGARFVALAPPHAGKQVVGTIMISALRRLEADIAWESRALTVGFTSFRTHFSGYFMMEEVGGRKKAKELMPAVSILEDDELYVVRGGPREGMKVLRRFLICTLEFEHMVREVATKLPLLSKGPVPVAFTGACLAKKFTGQEIEVGER